MAPFSSRTASDDSLLARVARAVPDLTLDEMAARTGISRSQLSSYENEGHVPPESLQKLADAAGVSLPFLEALLPLLRRLKAGTANPEELQDRFAAAQPIAAEVAAVISALLGEELAELAPPPPPPRDDPETVEALWAILAGCTSRQRRLRIQAARRYWIAGLRRKLCAESARAGAAGDAGLAQDLAQLAWTIARKGEGDPGEVAREESSALLHLASAKLLAHNRAGAEAAWRRAGERLQSAKPLSGQDEALRRDLEGALGRPPRRLRSL